jgi:hypothetical protein
VGAYVGVSVTPANAALDPELELGTNKDEKSSTKKFPIRGMVILDNSLGLGTFVSGPDSRPSLATTLLLRPYWQINDKQQLWLRFYVTKELIQNYESTTTVPNQILIGDTELRYVYNNVAEIPGVKIKVTPILSVFGGTSLTSRYQTRLAIVRPTVKLAYTYKWANLYYEARFAKSFHQYTSPTVGASAGIAVARDKGNEDLSGAVAIGSRNVEYVLTNRLTFVASLPKKISVSLDYMYVRYWTYDASNGDAFQAPGADSGRGVRDLTTSTIDLSWQTPWPKLAVSMGMTTAQTPKTADAGSFRPPFFDFLTPNSNQTAFYLDFIGMF